MEDRKEGLESQLIPLFLSMEGCCTQGEMNENVLATIERGYEPLNTHLNQQSGSVSIVGSAPSISKTYKELDGDILAINSAIGYLLDKGVVPKFAMIWDAAEICENFAVPHSEVTYLLGARCHPKVFERLKGCKQICWHAGGDHNILDFMKEHEIDEPMVNGGSAGVTRAMYLAVALGYKHLNIYGADSSYSDDGDTHITGSLVPEKDFQCWIGNGKSSKLFRTTPEWCAQVNEFRDIYSVFRHPFYNIDIDVFGNGMLPYMAELMKAKDDMNLLWDEDGNPHPSNKMVDITDPPKKVPHPLEENENAKH